MSSKAGRRGRMFVVSAPSGAGKTTVVEQVIARTPGLLRSVSFTSRPARPGEVDGRDYRFVSRARFESMIAGDEFLEWAEVFGNLYGTGVVETERHLAAGHDLVFVIDVQGARLIRRRGLPLVSVFLMPPSAAVLEERLRGRSHDSDEAIARRLSDARVEMTAYDEYDCVVVNDDVDACVEEVRAIVLAERTRLSAVQPQVEEILRSFGLAAGRGNREA